MACGRHGRCYFAVHDLRIWKSVEPVPHLSRLFDDVLHRSFPVRFAGSNNHRSVRICHSVYRVRARPDSVGFSARHDAPGGRLWQESRQRLKGALAWTGKLDHAGRSLFCPNRHDCIVDRFLDFVSIPSLPRARVRSQLSHGRRLDSVPNRHKRTPTPWSQVLLDVFACDQFTGRGLHRCVCLKWLYWRRRFLD